MFGKYFFSDYCIKDIKYLVSNGSGGFNFTNLGALTTAGNFSTFGEDKWGELYVADLNGKIFKFQGQACSPVAFITDRDTLFVCGATSTTLHTPAGNGFTYIWSYNGGSTGTNSQTLVATQSGNYSVNVLDANGCFATSPSVYVSFVAAPTATFAGLDSMYCINYPQVALVPSPTGGLFSGAGISGANFNPATAGLGFHNVVYTFADAHGCVAADTQIVRIDACLGIEENNFGRLTLLQNPNSGNFLLSFYLQKDEWLNFEITNILGQTVYNEKIYLNTGFRKLNFNLPFISKGMYSIKVNDDKQNAVKKFIVE
jgi:hypothetical protein